MTESYPRIHDLTTESGWHGRAFPCQWAHGTGGRQKGPDGALDGDLDKDLDGVLDGPTP